MNCGHRYCCLLALAFCIVIWKPVSTSECKKGNCCISTKVVTLFTAIAAKYLIALTISHNLDFIFHNVT